MHEIMSPFARVPCVYDLRWNAPKRTIEILCHKQLWSFLLTAIKPDSPIVEGLSREFSFQQFSLGPKTFGFDDAWQVGKDEESAWSRTLFAKLPRVRVHTKKPCSECEGTGLRGDLYPAGEKCIWCHGSGRADEMRWNLAYAHSATLTVFFQVAEMFYYDQKGSPALTAPLVQLITVETSTRRGNYGGALCGRYAALVRAELAREPKHTRSDEMELAMREAYDRMVGLRAFDKNSFQASLPYGNGWLNVDCPGQACCLHPNHNADINYQGSGYEFSCHNTDTPVQQLTLLAGLAALNMLCRSRKVGEM